jgi:hypothetical protein
MLNPHQAKHPPRGKPETTTSPEFCRFLRAALMSLEAGDFDMAHRIGFHVDRLDAAQPHGRLVCAMVDLRRGHCALAQEQLAVIQREFPDHAVVHAIMSSAAVCPAFLRQCRSAGGDWEASEGQAMLQLGPLRPH